MATLTAPDRLTAIWRLPSGIVGWLSAVNHKMVGRRYIVTAFVFFLLAGRDALRMRTQLAQPNMEFLSFEEYNNLFSMHGTVMMFFFAVPILLGFGIYLVPLMIGARDLALPRLGAFGYWCFLFGGIFLYASLAADAVPDRAWTAYPPLSGIEFTPDRSIDFWLLGLAFVAISTVAGAFGLIVSILKTRAPGMTLNRVPIFVWSMLVMAVLIVIGYLSLVAGGILLQLDRAFDARFYDPALSGQVLLWQHYFWIFGQAMAYLMLLPALGMVSMILATFTQRPVVASSWVVVSLVAIGVLSLGVWGRHLFATGLSSFALGFFGAMSLLTVIAIGVNVIAWIATIWSGRLVINVPVLWILGFFFIFVLGGITGVMLAAAPFAGQAHDTYFVVAYLHYILIGGIVFPVLGGLHYWLPKMTGRLLSDSIGHVSFWLVFVGTNLAFFPQYLAGLQGMARYVYTYAEHLDIGLWNLLSSIGAFVFAFGIIVFVANMIWSIWWGQRIGDNPWQAGSLEWATTSPPTPYNFRVIPTIASREPLWDQSQISRLGEGIEDEAVRATLGSGLPVTEPELQPTRRETYGTSARDAIPDHVIVLPGPSLWPLLLAVAVAVALVGILLDFAPAIGLSLAIGIVAMAAWHWPRGEERPA